MTVKYLVSIDQDHTLFFNSAREEVCPPQPEVGDVPKSGLQMEAEPSVDLTSAVWDRALEKFSAEQRKSAIGFTFR